MKKIIITIIAIIMATGIFAAPVHAESATSMDINDFESTMSVGSTQTISVILYPDGADDEIKYSSSNTSVATISQGGKITAKAAGATNITVTAGDLSETLSLTVEAVTIDVSGFESSMSVGDTQTISVTLYPSGASDKITYSSSNPSVATISQGGKIEAKSAGTTVITVSAGGASKTMTLTVSVGTTGITLNSTYITLKRGQKYTLKAKVKPASANQTLTYKSSDKSVAKVSSKGVIKAVGLGSASIIVSNGNISSSCEVIVNSGSSGSGTMLFNSESSGEQTDADVIIGDVSGSADSDKLKTLQKTGKTLVLDNEDYTITLEGADIVNTDIELSGELGIVKNEDGYTLSAGSGGGFLPGEISIAFKDEEMQKCEYVYLLDSDTGKYKLFAEMEGDGFKTDIAGTYRVTYGRIKESGPDKRIVVTGLGMTALLAAGYAVYRRLWIR